MKQATTPAPPEVLPLRRGWPRQKHVLKHLYRRKERWDLVIEGLPPSLHERALRAGCSPLTLARVQRGSERREVLCAGCAALANADHEAYYRPAYLRSLQDAREQGRGKALNDGLGRYAYVGTDGILVIATSGTDGRPPRVVTAYRVGLSRHERRRPDEFVEAAVRRWTDKTSLLAGDPQQEEEPG